MKAAIYETFRQPIQIQNFPDPILSELGAIIRVMATGVCRSDWHGWMGHDPMIALPHVPGHEFAGVIEAVGANVRRWQPGERVTVPFVCGCGVCPQCLSGNQQVCDNQTQPGFTHWGSFAELVRVDHADLNLVRLPDEIDYVAAASLGCRFITSFRAIVDQGRVSAGQWVAVHGCGGVGLSAIMIASAIGANVVAIDIAPKKLALAAELGATVTINAELTNHVVSEIKDLTSGGVHVSLDALGSQETCFNSIACLRKRGRHIQVGLMVANESTPEIPMDRVVANELEIYGSHGMQAHRYGDLLEMVENRSIDPGKLVGQSVDLETGIQHLQNMQSFPGVGATVINQI